jgi:hypothetical protein
MQLPMVEIPGDEDNRSPSVRPSFSAVSGLRLPVLEARVSPKQGTGPVVLLPPEFAGGEMVIRHQDRRVTFKGSRRDLTFIARSSWRLSHGREANVRPQDRLDL